MKIQLKIWMLISLVCCSTVILGQLESYVRINKEGLTRDIIQLYDSGRFVFIHDENCYAIPEAVGTYNIDKDSIRLAFFQEIPSQHIVEILNQKNDSLVEMNVKVLTLRDSTPLSKVKVFCRDTSRQKFDFTGLTDESGEIRINPPEGCTVMYVRFWSDRFHPTEIHLKELYGVEYEITIYLSEDPFVNQAYTGPTVSRVFLRNTNDLPLDVKIHMDHETGRAPTSSFFKEVVLYQKNKKTLKLGDLEFKKIR
ncbi:MAG: hypothetical protein AB8F95_11945 [Bacteroidia bacterium]